MANRATFAAWYQRLVQDLTREALLLTGNPAAAAQATANAFASAWRRWSYVSTTADPEAVVRRDLWKRLDRTEPDPTFLAHYAAEPALPALLALPWMERRLVVTSSLTNTPVERFAEYLGLDVEQAVSRGELATQRLSETLGQPSSAIKVLLQSLARSFDEDLPTPRGLSQIESQARQRRVFLTAVTALSLVATTLVTGSILVSQTWSSDVGRPVDVPKAEPLALGAGIKADDLRRTLGSRWIRQSDGGGETWLPCLAQVEAQERRQVGRFAVPGKKASTQRPRRQASRAADVAPARTAFEEITLFTDPEAAEVAFEQSQRAFTRCPKPSQQLVASYRVDGVGARATLGRYDLAGPRPRTLWLGVALNDVVLSRLVVVTPRPAAEVAESVGDFTSVTDGPATELRPKALVKALVRLSKTSCAGAPGATCAPSTEKPKAVQVAAVYHDQEARFLGNVDLFPLALKPGRWVGAQAAPVGKSNPANTRCQNAKLRDLGAQRLRVRIFVAPRARVPETFGLTQVISEFKNARAARRAVGAIRDALNGCEDRDLTSEVTDAGQLDTPNGSRQLGVWREDTEISEERQLTFRLGIARTGSRVTQLTLVTAPGADPGSRGMAFLAVRAAQRLDQTKADR